MLMRFDPFRDLDRWAQTATRPSVMPMDAYRDGDHFTVHFDLPGVDPGSIDLTVEKNVLNVSATRQWQRGDGQEVVASERYHGNFTRQLFLGDSLDTERIEASYDNGVLTLSIPVAEAAKPRKVEITGGGSNGKAKAITTESKEKVA